MQFLVIFPNRSTLEPKSIIDFLLVTQFSRHNFMLCYFPFAVSTAVTYDKSIKAIKVKVPDSDDEVLLHPATVRRNDRSAQSVVRDYYQMILSSTLCTKD